MMAIALAAAWVPLRRAARIDPISGAAAGVTATLLGWPVLCANSYSYLSATVGSTRIARRAGM
jgi:hypothetical protein